MGKRNLKRKGSLEFREQISSTHIVKTESICAHVLTQKRVPRYSRFSQFGCLKSQHEFGLTLFGMLIFRLAHIYRIPFSRLVPKSSLILLMEEGYMVENQRGFVRTSWEFVYRQSLTSSTRMKSPFVVKIPKKYEKLRFSDDETGKKRKKYFFSKIIFLTISKKIFFFKKNLRSINELISLSFYP